MKILSLKYEDTSTGWKLDLMEFNPHLTLLVGASGVGKTQILKAILNLKKIAQGECESVGGVKWTVNFQLPEQVQCEWGGAFENKGLFPNGIPKKVKEMREEFFIESEKLAINNSTIVERHEDKILYKGQEIVKLTRQQSVIFLLKEEELIKDVYKNIIKITFDFVSVSDIVFLRMIEPDAQDKVDIYRDLTAIRDSNEGIMTKLFLVYSNDKKCFKKIIDVFLEIFDFVQDVYIQKSYARNIPYIARGLPAIHIKEKGIANPVDIYRISSGMFRVLIFIAELYLCADDSVILIDEFENSLGVNCIEQISSSIMASERNLQFIITSHHPYIINNINYSNWKLVTRQGSVVKAEDAEKYGIGKSKHQAFTQLMNLDAYSEGIAS